MGNNGSGLVQHAIRELERHINNQPDAVSLGAHLITVVEALNHTTSEYVNLAQQFNNNNVVMWALLKKMGVVVVPQLYMQMAPPPNQLRIAVRKDPITNDLTLYLPGDSITQSGIVLPGSN